MISSGEPIRPRRGQLSLSEALQIGSIEINLDTRLGRMLAAGRLTATMRSKRTNQHITLTFQCKVKKAKWENAPFAEASHVFIKMGNGEWGATKIGTYYPNSGKLYFDTRDVAWQYAAKQTLYSATTGVQETEQFEITESNFCGKCGKELTDPVSIARGIGPTCAGAETGSKHYTQVKENLVEEKPQMDETLRRELQRVVTRPQDVVALAEIVAETDKKGRNVPRTFEALAAAAQR